MVPRPLPGLDQTTVGLRQCTQWMLNHTALLNRERERLEELGHTVYVENQNSFRLRGRYATLAGKPDLIAVKNFGRRNHRRQDRQAQPSPRRASHDLPVRGSAGPTPLPRYSFHRSSRVPRLQHQHPRLKNKQRIRKQPGSIDTKASQRRPELAGYRVSPSADSATSQAPTARNGRKNSRMPELATTEDF